MSPLKAQGNCSAEAKENAEHAEMTEHTENLANTGQLLLLLLVFSSAYSVLLACSAFSPAIPLSSYGAGKIFKQ
jgi:hypothetical protein